MVSMSIAGDRIKAQRERLGLSQADLAAQIKIRSPEGILRSLQGAAVGHWERGTSEPSAQAVFQMAAIFQKTPEWIMGFTDVDEDWATERTTTSSVNPLYTTAQRMVLEVVSRMSDADCIEFQRWWSNRR